MQWSLAKPWQRFAAAVALLRFRARSAFLARLSLSQLERFAIVSWFLRSIFSSRTRWQGIARYEMGREMVAPAPIDKWRALTGKTLETLIDQRLWYGKKTDRDKSWPDLQRVALALAEKIRACKQPVIISPFHYVSQYATIYVLDELRKALSLKTLSVVTGMPSTQYGASDSVMPNLRGLYTFGNEQRSTLGLQVALALRHDRIVGLFADVAPYAFHKFPMDTVSVMMRGREARIHSGVFRVGTPSKAMLLSFYLRLENGQFSGEILDMIPLASPDAPQQLADQIDRVLMEEYQNSLFAGHPSLYAFAPAK